VLGATHIHGCFRVSWVHRGHRFHCRLYAVLMSYISDTSIYDIRDYNVDIVDMHISGLENNAKRAANRM